MSDLPIDKAAWRLFLSYAVADFRQDRTLFRELRDSITKFVHSKNGSVFIDEKSLTPGTPDWRKEIELEIGRSDIFLALVSPNYFESENCGREWALFESRAIGPAPILALAWKNCHLPRAIRDNELEKLSLYDIRTALDCGEPVAFTLLGQKINELRALELEPSSDRFSKIDPKFPKTLWNTRVGRFLVTILVLVVALGLYTAQRYHSRYAGRVLAPEILRDIVYGWPQEQASAYEAASAVQKFENGWMVTRGEEHYAIVVKAKGSSKVEWVRKTGYTGGSPAENPEDILRKGFLWLYGQNALDRRLGNPLAKTHYAWVQFQHWTKGVLIYGVPADLDSYRDTDQPYKAVVAVFLDEENKDTTEGKGRITFIPRSILERDAKAEVFTSEPRASVNWYSKPKPRYVDNRIYFGVQDSQVRYCTSKGLDIRSKYEFLKGTESVQLF